MLQFLDDTSHQTILFYLNLKEELTPSVKFPTVLKKKAVYFTKKPNTPCPLSALSDYLTLGELAPQPLEFFSLILNEVYLPLLSNPKNVEKWPEVVASDVTRHFHKLNGAVHVISGLTKVTLALEG